MFLDVLITSLNKTIVRLEKELCQLFWRRESDDRTDVPRTEEASSQTAYLFYRGALEQRLEAEEKLKQLQERYGSVQVLLSGEEKKTLIELQRIMKLYSDYQESGSEMVRSEIYEQFKLKIS